MRVTTSRVDERMSNLNGVTRFMDVQRKIKLLKVPKDLSVQTHMYQVNGIHSLMGSLKSLLTSQPKSTK